MQSFNFEIRFSRGIFWPESYKILFEGIVPGQFVMGDDTNTDVLSVTKPKHHVLISTPFYMSKFLITQKIWTAVMGKNPSVVKGDDLPVINVSWRDCVQFCIELNKILKFAPTYSYEEGTNVVLCNFASEGIRLPTEAEWEYCARGGENYMYAGSNNLFEVGWFQENANNIMPVGLKKPNKFLLYDMSGNVFEWCHDRFDRAYYQECGEIISDPQGPTKGFSRIKRGGGWLYKPHASTVYMRGFENENYSSDTCGFRIVTSSIFCGESLLRSNLL